MAMINWCLGRHTRDFEKTTPSNDRLALCKTLKRLNKMQAVVLATDIKQAVAAKCQYDMLIKECNYTIN